MSKRYWKLIAACAVVACLSAPFPIGAQEQPMVKSATLARDVNGFRLGMTVEEANAIASLTHTGGEYFETSKDGIEYHFGAPVAGRLYRVESTQELGRFSVDQQFLETLERRLTEKYGKPSMVTGEVFWWNLVEPVTDKFGQTLPFATMIVTAMIGGIGDDRTLEISMIDYRIRWADEAAANRGPRQTAEGQVRF